MPLNNAEKKKQIYFFFHVEVKNIYILINQMAIKAESLVMLQQMASELTGYVITSLRDCQSASFGC